MRTLDPILEDALTNQKGETIIRVLTWTNLAAYNAAPTTPEHTWQCVKFTIQSTAGSAEIITDNNYANSAFTVFIIERGVEIGGVEYTEQSGLYFIQPDKFTETPGHVVIEGSSYPNIKISIAGDDTYQNVIEAFCTTIGKTAVFKDSAAAWLSYQFLGTGKQVILNKAERFENLLKQKYTILCYERSPKELVFYTATAAVSEWSDVIFADGQFVTVAETGTHETAYSTDGEGWTKVSAPSYCNAIAYSPTLDLYVAVGASVAMSSPDGVVWTSRTIGAGAWTDVKWLNDKFIATAADANIKYSTDGITWSTVDIGWTARSAAEANVWEGICWSPELGLFCAVAVTGTNRVMTSPDGITWTARTAASDKGWTSICWSPELTLFCAVSRDNGSSKVMTSPDGITWTEREPAEPNIWNKVCWSPELTLFCAVGNSGTNHIMTSPDGITWTARASSVNLFGVVWAPELTLFVAVGNQGVTSPDGITWTNRTISTPMSAVTWSPELGLLAAVGGSNCYTSPDGITWTARTIEANQWKNIAWSPERSLFVTVCGLGTNKVSTSTDGITWTSRAAAEENLWKDLAYSPQLELFAAVAESGTNRVMTATYTNPFTQYANAIAWSNSLTVIVGINKAYSSTNGTIWTERTIPAGTYNRVAFGNSLYVAVGVSVCATSPDGITWTARTIQAGTWNAVEWSSTLNLFVAVGDGIISTSTDGITWTARTVPEANNWTGITWSSSLAIFLIVANNGANRIASSTNGINWTLLTTQADFSLTFEDGTTSSIIHGSAEIHYLWRDEAGTINTSGNTDMPAWNLGYLESTATPPTDRTDPFYKFYLKKAPIRLDITDGDRIHFEPYWTLDPSIPIDASVIVTEHFDASKSPAWWQDITTLAIFKSTEGGALPSTIERVAAYTPLVSSGFDGNLTPSVNNLQALAEAVDNLTLGSAPTTTAANDFQVGNGAGVWIKKTLAETITILRTSLDSIFAPIAKGVTNGDSHDHNGGDGAAITDANLSTSDIITNNASASKHGFLKKLSNVATEFMNGEGNWATPAGGNTDGWTAISATATSGTLDAPTFEISFNADMTAIINIGDRIKITQSTTKYFIVTKVGAFSAGATIITCYGGTDYTLVASGTTAITNPYYSHAKAPLGFPTAPTKWTETFTDSTNRSQATPTQGTVYNLGSLSFSFPLGEWKVKLSACPDALSGSSVGSATHRLGLSTANNSFTDTTNVAHVGSYAKAQADGYIETFQSALIIFDLALTAKTTYYTVSKTSDNNMASINLYNSSVMPLTIKLVCAYL